MKLEKYFPAAVKSNQANISQFPSDESDAVKNTPGTRVGPGGRYRTLAVKKMIKRNCYLYHLVASKYECFLGIQVVGEKQWTRKRKSQC